MSTGRGSGAGNGGAVQPIPPGSRKIVQSLKEIVNCSDAEIYSALKDCNMDPNEAVNRLLSQDPFHEVKSKREKKKEGKDVTDSRMRGSSNNSSRGSKTGADRYGGRASLTSHNASDSGPWPVKPSYKKENGSAPYASSLSSVSGYSRSRGPTGISNGASAENEGLPPVTDDMPPVGIQPSSGYQSAWAVAPGHVSMADIVKRGRPHSTTSNAPWASNRNFVAPASTSHNNLSFTEDNAFRDPESVISSVEQIPIRDEWPIIEKSGATKVTAVPEALNSEKQLEISGVPSDGIDRRYEDEEVEETDDESINNSGENDAEWDSISTGKVQEDDLRGVYSYENNSYENTSSYPNLAQEAHADEEIGASVSSLTRNLQQVHLEKDGGLPSEGSMPSVIIPDYLQVYPVECEHLSFGSFGSGMISTIPSDAVATQPERPNLEEPRGEADMSSVGPPDTRSSEYYPDDSLRNVSDGGMFHRAGVSSGSYEASSASPPEELKLDNSEVAHGNQYHFPSPNSGYILGDAEHALRLNAAFSQTSSQMQNLSPFSNVMSYNGSLPTTLSTANAHPNREPDLHQYSPFPGSQSLSAKYGNSSIGGSGASLAEALKTANFSSSQPAPHTLSGSNVAGGPPLPQHLAMHPYSQHTLPLGPFANMIGYPFLPQSYTYMPSAFQQTFAGNNTYHQSLAAMLPQYKNNVSASSLPQSASGYGALGNSSTIPGNFQMNTPAAPSASALTYDDVLSSQYKDASHLISLQQNENSAMWLHGPNSRTMSALPANTYYNNYQGQNQQSGGGFRQAQQLALQNYGVLGYPDIYHNLPLDQPRDGPQGQQQQQPKQSQIWQNSY